MRDDFCAFILTHGRPDKVYTTKCLEDHGYTGKIYYVIDNEDKRADEYYKTFGKDNVLMFDKAEIAKTFDEGDNFDDRRAIIYARNVCFRLDEQVGCKYFIQLDDDYTNLGYRFNGRREFGYWAVKDLDRVLETMIEFFDATDALTVAMPQGGDFIGGAEGSFGKAIRSKRKAMNTFICSTDRPFQFFGRINEDVNAYTTLGRQGELFLTLGTVMVNQKSTQSNSGGMTDLYLDSGTYVKSFYSIMYSPSCVHIATMGDKHPRLHHTVSWDRCSPQIVSEVYRNA